MSDSDYRFVFDTNAPVILHIFAVVTIVINGMIGNGIILYIHMHKPLKEADIYIIALAFVDLFACIVICPQYPFLNEYSDAYMGINTFALVQLMGLMRLCYEIYLGLLTAIALNRVHAVFRPYTFTSSTKRSKIIVVFIIVISLLDACLSHILPMEITGGLLIISIAVCLTLISTSYLSIAVKLYRHRHKIEHQVNATSETIKKRIADHSTSEYKSIRNEKTLENTVLTNESKITGDQHKKTEHVSVKLGSKIKSERIIKTRALNSNTSKRSKIISRKTLKMFLFTTILFVVSNVPVILIGARLTDYFYITYFSFINHTANIVVYVCFNADFRKELVGVCKKFNSLIK